MTTPLKPIAVGSDDLGHQSKAPMLLGLACALIVGGYFLYAAYFKITDVRQFAVEIKNYKLAWLEERFIHIPAILIPWIEAAAAIALIVPLTRRGGAIVIGGLLIFFVYAVYDAAIVRNLKISCGCTGKDSGQAGWLTIGRNFLLLAATLASVYLPTWRSKSVASVEPSGVASGSPAA
ncbi:MAG: hypothetical protein KF841_05230 [Phycisphaerae bacterium]|nr:hypothetical protein [Phycisphaerae bacterium]